MSLEPESGGRFGDFVVHIGNCLLMRLLHDEHTVNDQAGL